MMRQIAVPILSMLLFAGGARAQQVCNLEAATKLVDTYAMEPFSARTWRVLKGLGDPEVAETRSDRWSEESSFKALAATAAPGVQLPASIGYECRIGYPLEVLRQRIKELGEGNPYVGQWIRSQIAVFAACDGNAAADLPPPHDLEGPAAQLQRDDRAYQQAALTFYRDRAVALPLFRAIAASSSLHRAAARYMVANILANGKQIAAARSEAKSILADPSLASVHGITEELLGYIANIEDTAEGWGELLDTTISAIEMPANDIVASDQSKAGYVRALNDIDFAGIRAKHDDWWLEGKLPENPTISKAIVDASRKHAIVSWMIAGQTIQDYYRAGSWSYVSTKWFGRVGSLVDRAMALTSGMPSLARDVMEAVRAGGADDVDPLLAKARQTTARALSSCGKAPESAAAGTLVEHAVRAAAAHGRYSDAYALIEEYPFKSALSFRRDTVLSLGRYLLAQGKLDEARRFRDRILTTQFLSDAEGGEDESLRREYASLLAWIAEDRARWDSALTLHPRKTELAILNFLPARELRRMAGDASLFMETERALLLRAAWTRVYALGKVPEESFTKELFELNPELARVAAAVRSDYPGIGASELRLLTILRTPRYNILVNAPGTWEPLAMTDVENPEALDAYDHNDRNWWCPFETDRHLQALRSEFDADAGITIQPWMEDEMKAVFDPVLTRELEEKREATLRQHPVVRTIDWKQLGSLAAAPSAPRRLTERALAWAQRAKARAGAAEALALAVRTTRYGCNWHGGHRAYSRPAQELLQSRYKGTTWAGNTPYWFDCMRQTWSDAPQDYAKVTTCEPMAWPKQKPLR